MFQLVWNHRNQEKKSEQFPNMEEKTILNNKKKVRNNLLVFDNRKHMETWDL